MFHDSKLLVVMVTEAEDFQKMCSNVELKKPIFGRVNHNSFIDIHTRDSNATYFRLP